MGAPFIPGSSLKGALRTALLDVLIPTPITERRADTLEARTLGYMNRQGVVRTFHATRSKDCGSAT